MHVAHFLNDTRVPLITPSATLAELNDKSIYHTLFRTSTTDDLQCRVGSGYTHILENYKVLYNAVDYF